VRRPFTRPLSSIAAQKAFSPPQTVFVVSGFIYERPEFDDEGYWAPVEIFTTGERIRARVVSIYAGAGYGIYTKLRVDDTVTVLYPEGDPSLAECWPSGWLGGDPPPQRLQDADSSDDAELPEELLVLGRAGEKIRIETQGGSDVEVVSDGKVTVSAKSDVTITTDGKLTATAKGEAVVEAPTVKLGASASRGVARLNDPVLLDEVAAINAWVVAVQGVCAANTPPIVIPNLVLTGTGKITPTVSTKVLAE